MSLVCVRDYEKKAREVVALPIINYYNNGSGRMTSLDNNQESFQRLRLRPKCLQDVSKVDVTTNILGLSLSMPIGICPTAFHSLANNQGEKATAMGAAKAGVIFTQSNLSDFTMTEVTEAAPDAYKWAQLYIFGNRRITLHTIKQAEENGYKALVLTVDSPLFGNIRTGFGSRGTERPKIGITRELGVEELKNCRLDSSLTWEDVKWLVDYTRLPIIAKGILRPEDALQAIDAGCKAIWVSNHGGRQCDTTPAPIEVLPEIALVVNGRVPLLVDGGFRQGTDVIKALALGANMILVGRPILWGLAVNGAEGVTEVLRLLKEELITAMMLCGTPTLGSITRDLVAHECTM